MEKNCYGSANGKETAFNADLSLIPGLERSPGEGKGYLLQYSGLEKSMGWQSQIRLSDFKAFQGSDKWN